METAAETVSSPDDTKLNAATAAKKMLLNRWIDETETDSNDTNDAGFRTDSTVGNSGEGESEAVVDHGEKQCTLEEGEAERSQSQADSSLQKILESLLNSPPKNVEARQSTDPSGNQLVLKNAILTNDSNLQQSRKRPLEGGQSPSALPAKVSQNVDERDLDKLLEDFFGDCTPPMDENSTNSALTSETQSDTACKECIVIDSEEENDAQNDVIAISSGDETDSEDVAITGHCFSMPHGKAKFILERTAEFSSASCARRGIKLVFGDEKKTGFHVQGPEKAVSSAYKDLSRLLASVMEVKQSIKDFGIRGYFQSETGKQFFLNTERNTNCTIIMPETVNQSTQNDNGSAAEEATTQHNDQHGQNTQGNDPIQCPPTSILPLTVSLVQGDIAMQQADVIVNPIAPQNLPDLANGPIVSRVLTARAGPNLQMQCSSMLSRVFNVGEVTETDGGFLNCFKVYHALVAEYDPLRSESLIRHIVWTCLCKADQSGCSSIAFPAIATGGFRYPPQLIAQWMKDVMMKFVACSLKSVAIVLHPSNHNVMSAFQAEFIGVSAFAPQQPSSSRDMKGLEDWLSSKQETRVKTVDLYYYSNSAESIVKARKAISEETDRKSGEQFIEDDAMDQLTEWEAFDIKDVVKRNNIDVSYDKHKKRLTLRGLTMDVVRARDEVKTILREFSTGEAFLSSVTWERLTNLGMWEEFPIRAVYVLEKAFKAHAKNPSDPKWNAVEVPEYQNGQIVKNTFNISNVQNDPNGISPPHLRRRIKGITENDFPANWTPVPRNEVFAKVLLNQWSDEYSIVKNKFDSSLPRYSHIIKIERIQNPFLYRQYRARLEAVRTNQFGNFPLTRELFHGTLEGKVDKICAVGFDRNFAGENGTAFGKGVYFAVNSEYSVKYAKGMTKCIFLVDVITGEYSQGCSNYKAPPEKFNSKMLYDSVVDNVHNPSIFVVFRDASTYPLYLITFC